MAVGDVAVHACRDVRSFEYNHSPARSTGAHFTSLVGGTILTPEILAETNAGLRPCMEFALGDETVAGISKRRAENAALRTMRWLRTYLDTRRCSPTKKPAKSNHSELEVPVATRTVQAADMKESVGAARGRADGAGDSGTVAYSGSTPLTGDAAGHVQADAPVMKRARVSPPGDDVAQSGPSCIGGAAEGVHVGGTESCIAVLDETALEESRRQVAGRRSSASGVAGVNLEGSAGAWVEGGLQQGELEDGGWVVGTVVGHAVPHRGRRVAQMVAECDSELAGARSRIHLCLSAANRTGENTSEACQYTTSLHVLFREYASKASHILVFLLTVSFTKCQHVSLHVCTRHQGWDMSWCSWVPKASCWCMRWSATLVIKLDNLNWETQTVSCSTLETSMEGVHAGYYVAGKGLGETDDEWAEIVATVKRDLPPQKPLFVCGVGGPRDIIANIKLGFDVLESGFALMQLWNCNFFVFITTWLTCSAVVVRRS